MEVSKASHYRIMYSIDSHIFTLPFDLLKELINLCLPGKLMSLVADHFRGASMTWEPQISLRTLAKAGHSAAMWRLVSSSSSHRRHKLSLL